jgi:diaminopimelate decarboxylase
VITDAVRQRASELADDPTTLPAYVYDLGDLRTHMTSVRAALEEGTEIFYAAKANPDPRILAAVAPYVHGIEVASGGELEHVRSVLPNARLAFGGPGKTDQELALAVKHAERVHVESPYELERLAKIAASGGRVVDVLLRVNLAADSQGAALAMNGPFGMDPEAIEACPPILSEATHLRLRGIHSHMASGLDASALVGRAEYILGWARPWLARLGCAEPEFNLGGGMAVDYSEPSTRFQWAGYGKQLDGLRQPDETFRIEPGRSLSVYAGWYVTDVLDVKRAHGKSFAVLRGGTQHLRTPVTKNHNQPFVLLERGKDSVPTTHNESVTLVGQLCTPKDVFARDVPVERIAVGDLVAFAMTGAYAWNISHHDFLMHPQPHFDYVD